jgi:hypothetical protein
VYVLCSLTLNDVSLILRPPQDAKASARNGDSKATSSGASAQLSADAKPTSSDPSETNKFRLLGDLPSLGGDNSRDKGKSASAAVALSLALHANEANPAANKNNFMKGERFNSVCGAH